MPFFSVLSILFGSGCASMAEPHPERALWITRWDWRTSSQLETVIENSAAAGFDTLLFQVRGTASTYWPSRLEPWAEELGGVDPGFDPLQSALELAHARGLELHAWVNVMPSWRGLDPPRSAEHLWHQRPAWHWHDAQGSRQKLCEDFYVSLNPCLPEVRAHLVAVLEELVSNYAIDGLHLDYMRFPNEEPALPAGTQDDWPRDARTLELFEGDTGLIDPDQDAAQWDRWRADCVTRLLRSIRHMIDRLRPASQLSCAVGPTAELAAVHHQDWPSWVEEGLLDRIFPMNYSADMATFEERLAGWQTVDSRVPVMMGVMAGIAPPQVRLEQLEQVEGRFGRSCLFAYCMLWDSANTILGSQDADSSQERSERRAWLLP